MTRITAEEAHQRLHAPGELAFLDMREEGQFGEGHPLFAVPCPYSRLELRIPVLVPRRSAPIVLIDGGDGVAERAARRLSDLGYTDVALIEGGATAWANAGFALFKGVNVPSKVLGELVEEAWHPDIIAPETLAAWQTQGREYLVFDARPPAEYAKMRVPSSICIPNGELAHRLAAVLPDPITPVVVTCAGRTRGLIGVAGLRLAGIENPVFALENGTQGWALAGFELERGNNADSFPQLTEDMLVQSRANAERLASRFAIPWIGTRDLERMFGENDRSTFVFDVRSAEEAQCDSIPVASHAPGGQLVQATDQWAGVRRARVVLCDDAGLRASLAALWLSCLGYETFVLPVDDRLRALSRAPESRMPIAEIPAVLPLEAWRASQGGATRLLDIRPSRRHQESHPEGALWAIRPRIGAALGNHRGPVVLIADEPRMADLAAIDLREFGCTEVYRLEGGFEAWEAADLPVSTRGDDPKDEEMIDFLFFVHDRHDGNLESSRRYLAWETDLLRQLDPCERGEFHLPAGAAA